MLNKVTNSNTAHAFVEEGRAMVKKYHWEDKVVRPWINCPMMLTEIIDDVAEYDKCTCGSKEYLRSLANGLVDILNHWEEFENEPKVTIKYKEKVLTLNKSLAECFIEEGAIVIKETA